MERNFFPQTIELLESLKAKLRPHSIGVMQLPFAVRPGTEADVIEIVRHDPSETGGSRGHLIVVERERLPLLKVSHNSSPRRCRYHEI